MSLEKWETPFAHAIRTGDVEGLVGADPSGLDAEYWEIPTVEAEVTEEQADTTIGREE